MLKESQIKKIVIVVGTIVAFLLMWFLPFIRYIGLGSIFSLAIIASLALIFGKVVGGIVGGLVVLLFILFNKLGYRGHGDFPFNMPAFLDGVIPYDILDIISFILFILYGVIIGKVFEKKQIKPDSKNIVSRLLPISLLSAGLYILLKLIGIINRYSFWYPLLYFSFLPGLFIGVVVFVFLLIYLKCVKRNIPFFEYIPPEKIEDSISLETLKQSKFDGGLLSYIGWKILGFLITIFTFGICYPWALCMVYGWKINHTIIEGRRLKFNGKAISLFGHWLLWILLTIITLGIYSFWLFIALEKWKVKNTTFVETESQV